MVMAKRKPGEFPGSPAYFDKAVYRQRDDRKSAAAQSVADATWAEDDPSWRSLVKAHQDGVWFADRWGPPIGSPGCRVPNRWIQPTEAAA